jgi:hypothetical protein
VNSADYPGENRTEYRGGVFSGIIELNSWRIFRGIRNAEDSRKDSV